MNQLSGKHKTSNPAPGYRLRSEHLVSCRAFDQLVMVSFEGEQVAQSNQVILVEETGHKPVFYFPADHVDLTKLMESGHVTRCPFKGKASYWNVKIGEHEIDNAVWSYEMPYDEALELAGLMAFYDRKVQITVKGEIS